MSEAKGRREANPVRARPPRADSAPEEFGQNILDHETPTPAPEDGPLARPPLVPRDPEHIGFDEETNSRYEEIKRGTTFISELQAMTIPQLLKTAKEEGVAEYTGLKKQDLIFKILKERV